MLPGIHSNNVSERSVKNIASLAAGLMALAACAPHATPAQTAGHSHPESYDQGADYRNSSGSGLSAISGPTEGVTLMIALSGAAEGPGLGDPDGSGMAELLVDSVRGRLCYVLTVESIAPAQLAHIHRSPKGEAGGPIVVQLEAPTDGQSERCVAIAPAVAEALLTSPSDYYVNVHNAEHPAGAVRGQLG